MHERKPWTPRVRNLLIQEDELIRESVRKCPDLKWKQILICIKKVDRKFARNSKQVRERYDLHYRVDGNFTSIPTSTNNNGPQSKRTSFSNLTG